MAVCKSCKAPIIWCRSVHGSWMPVNAESDPAGNMVLDDGDRHPPIASVVDLFTADDRPRYMPHHATCPNAAEHRS